MNSMSLESSIEGSDKSGFLRGISQWGKNKFVQYSLAGLLTLTSACGGSPETPIDPIDPPTNKAPVVSTIPNQTINKGETFTQINFDNYVTDSDNADSEMNWQASGNSQLSVSINPSTRTATITKPYSDFTGSETITFKATDPEGASSQDSATFKINAPPTLSNIQSQTIDKGQNFQTINLNSYLSDPDNTNSELNISYSGNTDLNVNIDPTTRIMTVTLPDQNYTGSESITVTATDPYNLEATASTILKVNAPPTVYDIPDQTINEGSSFNPITLDDYVSDPDNTKQEQTWDYSGNTDLTIDINQTTRIATITPPSSAWTGEETITFEAKDPRNLSSQDQAIFKVNPVIPQNNNPTFTSTPPATGTEGTPYNYDADATDIDGDTLTYSLLQAPSFLSINSSTGLITGTPADEHSNLNHTIEVKVDDGNGGSATQLYTLNIKNTETVSGNVKAFETNNNLSNTQITLVASDNTTYTATTDQFGNWSIPLVLDKDYETTIKDLNGIHDTYKPRILRSSKTKNLEGKLTNRDVKLFNIANRDYINDVGRIDPLVGADIMKAWCPDTNCTPPIWDIYTTEVKNSTAVSQTLIDGVKNTLKNKVSQFYQQTIIDADINVIPSLPPFDKLPPNGQPTNGHVYIYWDNNVGAVNREWSNGNKITSGYVIYFTSSGEPVILQELSEVLIGSGETQDANHNNSIFYDGPPTATVYSSEDLIVSDMHFNPTDKRAIGNRDWRVTDRRDEDPDGTIWNQ